MKRRLQERALAGMVDVDSAGTGGWHAGELPDARMRRHAACRGYVLDSRARQFDPATDFDSFDMIVAMDEQNVMDLRQVANTNQQEKIFRAVAFCHRFSRYPEVPDPYFGGEAGFELVLDILEEVVEGLLRYLFPPPLPGGTRERGDVSASPLPRGGGAKLSAS